MPPIMTATLLAAAAFAAAAFSPSSALAQTGTNRAYCLLTGSAEVCAYDTFMQCQDSRRGNADFCKPNNIAPSRLPRQQG